MSNLLAPNGKPSNLTNEQWHLVRTPAFISWFGDWENDPANASKVVDENGEPLVVYHGSKNDFNTFSLNYIATNTGNFGFLGVGFYFATNKSDAKNYGEIVKPYFLKSLKKLDLRNIEYKELAFMLPKLLMKNGKTWKDAFIEIDKIKDQIKFIEIEDLKNGFFNVHYQYKDNWEMLPRRTIGEIESDKGLSNIVERIIEENPNNIGSIGNYFNPEYLSKVIKNEGFDSIISNGTNIYDLSDEVVVFEPNQIKLADGTNTTFDGSNPDIRFDEGGGVKELSKKEKQEIISNQNKFFGDGLPTYKLSADGNWVMKLDSRTNKYKTYNRFDLFHDNILEQERVMYARENAHKVFEYLDSHGAELLNKSIYGSRYYIYKNNRIRVSNHHNQSEQKNEGGLNKYKHTEHNFYSYEKDGWKQMISEIESLNNSDVRFDECGSVLLAPNGKPSNLTPEQYKLVRTPAFISWFGDWEKLTLTKINDSGIDEVSLKRLEDGVSKVVDENGEPLVAYHSSNKEFNIFEKEKISENFEYSFGFHFSNDIEDSKKYGKITKSFFLKIINPFVFNVKDNSNGSVFIDMNRYEAIHEIVKSRKSEREIDGVIAYSSINGYVTMYSNQIKLADGTNTTFDGNNPDIRFDDGGSTLLAPNGKPSNLTPEQYKLVRTPAFISWFGDWENDPATASKVIDENGEPLIVFHRSKKAFYLFDTEKQLNGWLGKGFYFSESKDEFKNYGNKLLSVFLNIKNPFKVKGESPTDFLYELRNIIDTDENNTTQNLKNNYYDGVIYKHWDYEGRMFTCFESEQIKLADGTNTTFDGNNPDIRYNDGGSTLLAPNGKPSNLTPEQYKLVRTPAFISWFGNWEKKQFLNKHKPNSTIYLFNTISLDENGEPRIWCRATHYQYNIIESEYIYLGAKKSYVKQYGIPKEFFVKADKTIFIDNQDIERKKLGIKFDYLAEYISDENEIPRAGKNYEKLKDKFKNQKDVLSVWEYFTFVGNEEIIELFKGWFSEYGFDSVMYWETGLKNNFQKYPIGLISLYFGDEYLKLADGTNTTFDGNNPDIRFKEGGKIELNEESQQLVDIISMNPNSDKYQKYKDILLNKFGINFDDYYKDDYYIENANLSDIKRKDDFLNYDKYIEYALKIFRIRGLFNDYHAQNIEGIITIDEAKEIGDKLDFKIINQEYIGGAENYASHSIDVITIPNEVDINTFVHEIGHHYDHFESKEYEGLANTSTYASSLYEIGKSDEVFAENFKNYFIAPKWLKEKLPMVYSELDTNINEKYKKVIFKLIDDIKQKYNYGGQPINKETMNPKDTITMDIPLLIRMLEVAREDIKSDEQLHRLVENIIDLKDNLLTMDDYDEIVMGIIGNEGDKVAEPIENDLYSKVNDLKEHPELLKYFLKHGGQTTEQSNKISKVMHEFNEGKLKTSYGEIVTDPKQAIAIALSEAGIEKKNEGGSTYSTNYDENGKISKIHYKDGDVKLSLESYWYEDDEGVELVPVSELVKFREFNRLETPKWNQEESNRNINNLKNNFMSDGVKEPLIIEYNQEDKMVLLVEGNHRLNSAVEMGLEYLPARVRLKKYGKYKGNTKKSAMSVKGVEPNQFGYISSALRPSQVGINSSMPLKYEEGGIIEGQLHSECNDDDGCGVKFQVGSGGTQIEAERDEAVIVSEAFNSTDKYTIRGTCSQIASALNIIGGGKNFDKGATIMTSNGSKLNIPKMNSEAKDTDVESQLESGSIIINRRSMADSKVYSVSGTTRQIASAINSMNGNGVVIEAGAEVE